MKSYIQSILIRYMDDELADILSSEIMNEVFKSLIIESATRLFENWVRVVKDEAKLCEGRADD